MDNILNLPDDQIYSAKVYTDSTEEIKSTFDVKWQTPPKVADLKTDYQSAFTTHSQHVSEVNEWIAQFNGQLNVDIPKGRSRVQPKLIRKQAEWRYAALSEPFLSTYDLFQAEPVTYEDKAAAIQNQLLLNYQINNRIDKVKFIDEYVRTAVDEGTVVCKVGWEFKEEEREVEEPIIDMVPVQDPNIAQQMMLEGLQPFEPGIVGTKLVKKMVTVANHPTVEVCEYDNVIIDPTCKGDITKAKFVIHRYTTSLDILKADSRYKNIDAIIASENSPLAEPDYRENTTDFVFRDKARKKVVMYEYWGYWDVEGTGEVKPILASWIGNTLVRLEENPYPDKQLPFVIVQYLPRRKQIYGEPDGALLEDNQKIVGAVTRGMIDLMGKSANSQMGVRVDALDVVNKRRFDNGQDYFFNGNVDPRQAFHMHTYPEIPNSAMNMLQLQNIEAESLTGVKAFSGGLTGNALGDTATGIRGALDAASKRELGILRRLANGIIQIGRKFISMNAEFLDEEEVVRVTNEEFVPIKRDDLAGQIDLRLTISTAEEDNNKAQELAFMLQTIGNSVGTDVTMMILADIARLRKMPDLAKRLETFQPQPDPMQQRMAELQVALLEAQVINERAKGKENEIDAIVKMSKAELTAAQARKVSTDADLNDLDFVEQAEGVKHTRELDKQDRQVAGQIDTAAAKAMLDFQRERSLPKKQQ